MEFFSSSQEDTIKIGYEVGSCCRGGEVVALYGTLGAGKTVFVKGLAKGLGINDNVTSPTFAIVHSYEGRLPLLHFDMYRLSGPDELIDIGWDDYLDGKNVLAVEWSENVAELIPKDAIRVTITAAGENSRSISVEGGDFS